MDGDMRPLPGTWVKAPHYLAEKIRRTRLDYFIAEICVKCLSVRLSLL